jgi:hypothetical protein
MESGIHRVRVRALEFSYCRIMISLMDNCIWMLHVVLKKEANSSHELHGFMNIIRGICQLVWLTNRAFTRCLGQLDLLFYRSVTQAHDSRDDLKSRVGSDGFLQSIQIQDKQEIGEELCQAFKLLKTAHNFSD